MKFLEGAHLDEINRLLANSSSRFSIDARVESYSCKMVSEEKKQYKALFKKAGSVPQVLSPPQTLAMLDDDDLVSVYFPCGPGISRLRSISTSEGEEAGSSGAVTDPIYPTIAVKPLFYLIGTLNESFGPEYDFSQARSDEFCLEPTYPLVQRAINNTLSTFMEKYGEICSRLWHVIDEEIVLRDCLIYSYRPDRISDPYSSGCVASLNYFFYNKNLRRVLFLSVRVSNPPWQLGDDEEMDGVF